MKERLKYWHIFCVNCGEKICTYKKDVKNIKETKTCKFCKEKIRVVIGCNLTYAKINLIGNWVLINNSL